MFGFVSLIIEQEGILVLSFGIGTVSVLLVSFDISSVYRFNHASKKYSLEKTSQAAKERSRRIWRSIFRYSQNAASTSRKTDLFVVFDVTNRNANRGHDRERVR